MLVELFCTGTGSVSIVTATLLSRAAEGEESSMRLFDQLYCQVLLRDPSLFRDVNTGFHSCHE